MHEIVSLATYNFNERYTPGPLSWLSSPDFALIYAACYVLLDACENFC